MLTPTPAPIPCQVPPLQEARLLSAAPRKAPAGLRATLPKPVGLEPWRKRAAPHPANSLFRLVRSGLIVEDARTRGCVRRALVFVLRTLLNEMSSRAFLVAFLANHSRSALLSPQTAPLFCELNGVV